MFPRDPRARATNMLQCANDNFPYFNAVRFKILLIICIKKNLFFRALVYINFFLKKKGGNVQCLNIRIRVYFLYISLLTRFKNLLMSQYQIEKSEERKNSFGKQLC